MLSGALKRLLRPADQRRVPWPTNPDQGREALSSWRRHRELAGDQRAGAWARAKARRAQRDYLRRNWRRLIATAAVMLAPLLVCALLVPGGFARGFLVGAGLAAAAGALCFWVLQVTGTGPAMMGDLAEQWTASELRGLGKGWRVVNHLPLQYGDIDHIAVGQGGAWLVETKWSATPWTLDPPDDRVLRAAHQANTNARRLRLWTGFKAAGIDHVHPVVMLWGPGTAQLAAATGRVHVDGVTVVPGPSAHRWRTSLPTEVLTGDQVEAAWRALDAQVRSGDAHQRQVGAPPAPRSVGEMTSTAAFTASAAALGFLASAWLLRLTGELPTWAAGTLTLAAAALPLRRNDRARWPALGWQTGLTGALLMGAAAYLLQVLG